MKNEMINDSNLDKLFHSARNQAPAYLFSETQAVFASAASVGAGSAAGLKILGSSLFKTKFFIMTVTVITILTSAVLVLNSANTQAKESILAKSEQTLLSKQQSSIKLKVVSLNSAIDNSLELNSLVPHSTIINALNPKPFPTYSLNTIINTLPAVHSKKETNGDTISVSYIITQNTTNSELNDIKSQAKTAGIDFVFVAKIKNNRIKKLDYSLRAVNGARGFKKAKINISSPNFQHEMRWRTNGAGEFVDFNDNSRTITYDGKKPLTIEKVDKLMAKAVKDELKNAESAEGYDDKTRQEIIMLNSNSGKNLSTVSQFINNLSTEESLQDLQLVATEAGVILKYDVIFRRNSIRKLDIKMTIIDDAGDKMHSYYYISKSKRESFSYPIIWRIDESGKAVDFGDPKQIKFK